MTPEPTLRPAVAQDSMRLFAWVNSPDSLSGKALTTKPITRPEHETWYAQRLDDAQTTIHMIEMDGAPVGQVRLQQNASGAYAVDIYVEPDCRGHGLAAWAVQAAVRILSQEKPAALIVAMVRIENKASAALFLRTGFTETDRSDTFVTFERKATS